MRVRTLFAIFAFVITSCGDNEKKDEPLIWFQGGSIKSVSMGLMYHSCFIDGMSEVYCWGDSESGALGSGAVASSSVPLKVTSTDVTGKIIELSSGSYHNCVINAQGEVYCWGSSTRINSEPQSVAAVTEPTRIHFPNNSKISNISSGHYHTCAVSEEGQVYCWGINVSGELGSGDTESSIVPVGIAVSETFKSVHSSEGYTCGLTTAGDVYCWGYGSLGQLGPNVEKSLSPVKIDFGSDIKLSKVSAGIFHACAISELGETFCWGGNHYGVITGGTVGGIFAPTKIAVLESVKLDSISSGKGFSCGIGNGVLYCWGSHETGNRYDKSSREADTSKLKEFVIPDSSYFIDVSAGQLGTCAVTNDQNLYCWANSRYALTDPIEVLRFFSN
ncbi:RCC1 domain-containing protein [Oligoflexus tunisiensis]|uniref:RCC1 domain-containing protein n=1 Tax=Oligoflexus tunisiensis TaxID=708132 RepID=UPI00114CDCBD|nr:hypothetical protein [Oligoflexus tunisiensis]